MPFTSKRQTQCLNAIKQRWSNETRDQDVLIQDASIQDAPIQDALFDRNDFSTDTDGEEELDTTYLNFKDMIGICDLADLFELCEGECNVRYLSVLIYMILRYFNISYRDARQFLKNIGALTAEVAHKWSKLFMEGDFHDFVTDGRGGKRGDRFYDIYPELEVEAKSFAVLQCQQKAASFTVSDLANFIDKRFHEINNVNKTDWHLIRSVESCRLDLRRWGARFESNTNRPYFEGHDRPDVLAHRHQFINHFLSNQTSYYTITENGDPQWITPAVSPRTIIICKTSNFNLITVPALINLFLDHDESTFRSGDVRGKRWLIDDSAPFFNKGHGRSVMISDFLVEHPSGHFFELNEKEWKNAVKTFPDLSDDTNLRYEDRSATLSAHLGIDPYFDNSIILLQFERLFKLIKFKDAYRNHEIEILVDNARTHTKREFSINDFGKGIGTRHLVSSIEYIDEQNNRRKLDFVFQSGPHRGESKGLLVIAEELGFQVSAKTTLDQLKTMLSGHPAFQTVCFHDC